MTEQKRKIIIYFVFVIAMIYGVINLYPKTDNKNNKTALDNSAQLESSQKIIEKYAEHNLIDTLAVQDKSWGRDPFHVISKSISTKPYMRINTQLVLSGIFYNEKNPIAIINKKTLRVGDNIENAKIIKINKKNVIIIEDGKNITLTISKG